MMSRSIQAVWLVLALVAGCTDQTHFPPGSPIIPGGGTGTGSTPRPDAAVASIDAGGGTISGTVCQRTTIAPQACTALTGAGGLTLTLEETDATTQLADDGTFSMPGVPGMGHVTLVTATGNPLWFGGAVSIALETDGSGRANIPVLSQDDAETLVASNAGGLPAGTGFLVVHTGTGITLTDGTNQVYYDTGVEPVLSTTAPTATSGTAVVFGALGAQMLSLVRDTTTVPASATVFAGAATFVEVPF